MALSNKILSAMSANWLVSGVVVAQERPYDWGPR